VLADDDRVECNTPEHGHLEIASGCVIVIFCFGLPIVLMCYLMYTVKQYKTPDKNPELVARVRRECGCSAEDAKDFVRDIRMERRLSFAVAPYRPAVLWWEAIDMFRKV
jgi:hypothetical protein